MNYERFFTQVKDPTVFEKFDFSHSYGFIGSCFSDHIFHKFKHFGLTAWQSPFGTTYNPLSIEFQLDSLLNLDKKYTYFQAESEVFSWETAHLLTDVSEVNLAETLMDLRKATRAELLKTNVLFITLGTASAFELVSSGQVVANCHKQPDSLFKKTMLPIEDMYRGFAALIFKLKEVCPNLTIVLTVSPVRHIRGGLIENSRSKARLLELCHRLVEQTDATYLPVYEWVIDELRDYRFFEADGVHPNAQAVDFVYEKMMGLFFEKKTQDAFKEIDAYRKMQQHRPLSARNSEEFQRFEKKVETKKAEIESKFGVFL
jgi:hypothetical protein